MELSKVGSMVWRDLTDWGRNWERVIFRPPKNLLPIGTSKSSRPTLLECQPAGGHLHLKHSGILAEISNHD